VAAQQQVNEAEATAEAEAAALQSAVAEAAAMPASREAQQYFIQIVGVGGLDEFMRQDQVKSKLINDAVASLHSVSNTAKTALAALEPAASAHSALAVGTLQSFAKEAKLAAEVSMVAYRVEGPSYTDGSQNCQLWLMVCPRPGSSTTNPSDNHLFVVDDAVELYLPGQHDPSKALTKVMAELLSL
jgi:hypothetical protein